MDTCIREPPSRGSFEESDTSGLQACWLPFLGLLTAQLIILLHVAAEGRSSLTCSITTLSCDGIAE